MKTRSHRHTETTIETHEVWLVRRPTPNLNVLCRECTKPEMMLSPEEAARRLHLNPRTIYQWVETGKTHFTEVADGWLLVCLASLPRPDTADSAFPLPASGVTD